MYIMNKKAIYESIMSQVAQVVKKQLNENMEYDEVWDIFEEMKEMLGAEELVNELAQALSTDELEENLRFIDKNHDLGLFRVNDGFDDETIIRALNEALAKGKKTIRSVDRILVQYKAKEDMEKTGMSNVKEVWDDDMESLLEVAKAKWIDD